MFWARSVNVVLGLLTVALVARLGRRWWSRDTGDLAALLLAVAMLHATDEMRFALVDVPCALLLLLAITSPSSSVK